MAQTFHTFFEVIKEIQPLRCWSWDRGPVADKTRKWVNKNLNKKEETKLKA